MDRERQRQIEQKSKWLQETQSELAERFTMSRYQFVSAEVDVGVTFCEIAASTSDPEKRERNKTNAEKACESARHFLHEVNLSEEMKNELERRLKLLETMLARLG